jgi:hypothetical protein
MVSYLTITLLGLTLAPTGTGAPAIAHSTGAAAEAPKGIDRPSASAAAEASTAIAPSAGAAVDAPAGVAPPGSPAAEAPNGMDLGTWAERHALEIQLAQLNADLERTRQQVAAGMTPSSAVAPVENQIASVTARLAAMNGDLEIQRRMASLRRPVVVQLRDASVRQAAQAISQASGVPIGVDDRVPTDVRLTMDVQGVPLATVLEAMARQANLMIAPDPKNAQGFVLKPWPSMEVNGQKQEFTGQYAPWSDELGPLTGAWTLFRSGLSVPYGLSPKSMSVLGADAASLFTRTSPYAERMQVSPGADGSLLPRNLGASPAWSPYSAGGSIWGGTRTAPLAVTSLGDRMVVTAQPGTGPQGETGTWLTVYRLEGDQLRKVASTFDPAETNGGRARGRPAPARNPANTTPAPSAEPRR